MNKQTKPILSEYEYRTHRLGRISTLIGLLLILSIPLFFCVIYDVIPNWTAFFQGALKIVPMFYAVGIIEIINYAPMLGAGGTYLAFITGNLTNMKIPAAQVGLDRAGVETTSEQGEIISTISVAVSTIVTDVIIIIGMLLVIPLTRWINSVPVLQQVFDLSEGYVISALFGALGVVFISRNWKLSVAPLVCMLALFIFLPGAVSNGTIGALSIPIAALIAAFAARFMFNKGWLVKKEKAERK
jgi:hypothetical protein